MPTKSLPTLLAALAATALLAFAVPISANHTQADSGRSIAFDHRAGNQWWVEVAVTGADAGKVAKVEAEVGPPWSKPWTNLPKQSWGSYAASFELGTDADVRFRATFTDGTQMVSCWFDHPAGTEMCSYPPGPGTWRSSLVGDAGRNRNGGETQVIDMDRDGVGEVLVASGDGVYMFDRVGGAWTRSTVFAPAGDQEFRLLAAGNADNDDIPEVYTVGRYYDGQRAVDRLMWHHYNWIDGIWYSDVVWDFYSVRDILLGDVNDDGKDELVAITYNNQDHVAYVIGKVAGDFSFTEVARTLYGTSLGMAAVADADRDRDDELYILQAKQYDDFTGVLRIDWRDGRWAGDILFASELGREVTGFAAGDADNDGFDELYILSSGFFPGEATTVHRFSPREAGWNEVRIPLGTTHHRGLEVGDANGDGFREIYSGTREGHLAQVMWMGSAWQARAVHQLGSGDAILDVATGDADGDGRGEAYGLAFDWTAANPTNRLHRFGLASGGPVTTTTTTGAGGFDATFTGVRGNEWWQQTSVSATGGTLAKVDVRINNGAWNPLTKQSWGGWAASYRAVDGSTVQFRATSTAGATDLSDCYRWIPSSNTDASKVACPGSGTTSSSATTTSSSTTTTTGAAFTATFSGIKGNEWWVQANVGGNQPIAGVDARIDCSSAWKPLAKQSWGGWAASFHVPAGSKVDFRARATSGATDLSDNGYVWPNATPTGGC